MSVCHHNKALVPVESSECCFTLPPCPHNCTLFTHIPWWLRWWRICLQCKRPRCLPWIGKILWRRKYFQYSSLDTFHWQRNVVSYHPFMFLEKSPRSVLSHLEGEMGPLCFSFKIYIFLVFNYLEVVHVSNDIEMYTGWKFSNQLLTSLPRNNQCQ